MPNPNQNPNEGEKKMSPKLDPELSTINEPIKKPFLQPKRRSQNNQNKTYQDLASTFKPSTEFNFFTEGVADNSSSQYTHNQDTGQEDDLKSHDDFFLKVEGLKAANPFPFLSQAPTPRQNIVRNRVISNKRIKCFIEFFKYLKTKYLHYNCGLNLKI